MRHGKIYKNVEFYGGSNMSQIDWDRIVADADNEARKKVQKESETVRIRLILSANLMLLAACWLIHPAQCKEARLMN